MDVDLESFARDLAAEVEDSVREGSEGIFAEEEFTRIILERLAEEGAIENPVLLWQEGSFSRAKYKITGFSMPDDDERLLLVTTVYSGEVPPTQVPRDLVMTAIQQAIRFYECSKKGLHKAIEPSNTDASDLARRIFEAKDAVGVVRVIVLSDGLTGSKSFDLKENFLDTRILVDVFGIERLHRILGQGQTRNDIVVDLREEMGAPLPCLKASDGEADYEAYLAAVPGKLLASVYEKYGTRLLELNVRAFLGLSGRKSVNAGLRATIKDTPHRFLAYNNGIVATVDDLETVDLGNGMVGISKLTGLQIVNGGQTTASLHRAKRQDNAKLEGLMVPAKIIKVGGAELDQMVSAISKSANSQNTVQPADFSANDPFQVEVEKLSNNTWLPDGSGRWFFERARGSFTAAELRASFSAPQRRRFAQETPKARRFSKTDLAKYINAWEGAPHMVSFGSQKNFQFFMQSLKDHFPDGYLPDTAWYKAFIAKALIFRAAQAVVREVKFSAYQANITAYLVSSLSWMINGKLNFEMVWSKQAVSPELRALLAAWAPLINDALRTTAGAKMPSEWAKKSECRDAIEALELPLPKTLPPEFITEPAASGGTVKEAAKKTIDTTGLGESKAAHSRNLVDRLFRSSSQSSKSTRS